MLIVDGQIHLWAKGTPSPQHRQEPFSAEEAIAAMDAAGVDRALVHPVLWDPDSNELAQAAVGKYPGRFAIMGWFYLDDPQGPDLVAHWKERPGMLGLANPGDVALDGVLATYLAYSYVGVAALNRMRPWRHCPRTLAVIARSDHLTSVRNAERVHAMIRDCGAEVETWIADGTHSFDEPMTAPPMRYHPELAEEAVRRFAALLEDVAVAPQAATGTTATGARIELAT